MSSMTTTRPLFLVAFMLSSISLGSYSNRVLSDDAIHRKASKPLALTDLNLQHDGKEVTIMFKVTHTQLVAGTRDGQFEHVYLHHRSANVQVYVHGELADAFHRFDLARSLHAKQVFGRTIRATGKVSVHQGPPIPGPNPTDPDPIYNVVLRDLVNFQIVADEA